MTALADYDAYTAALAAPKIRLPLVRNWGTANDQFFTNSGWLIGGDYAGVAPSAAVAPTSSTLGAWYPDLRDSAQMFIARASTGSNHGTLGSVSVDSGYTILIDRLSHQGGLSGIVTTAQTTNLPTAALTRYTSGVGVMMGLEVYSTIGSTGTTVTCSYTNSGGTAGRTSTATVFGGVTFRNTGAVLMMPLQSGDVGVKSVESVTVLATTGTAGNFGVTLFKPLLALPTGDFFGPVELDTFLSGALVEIVDNACINAFCRVTSGDNATVWGTHFVPTIIRS